MEAILVCNGPGELYTWLHPTMLELRRTRPDARIVTSLIPCQFAAGGEGAIATRFRPDAVTLPADFIKFVTRPGLPEPFTGEGGFVVSLGGNLGLALRLGAKLGYPAYRYGFVPTWRRGLTRLFVPDEATRRRARLFGAPPSRIEVVGNLVADAVEQTAPVPDPGEPHIYLNPGSRDGFAVHLLPLFIAVVDALSRDLPGARFIWAVSSLLSDDAISAGVAGVQRGTLGGLAGRLEGDSVRTPSGGRIELTFEAERYRHMRAADLAVTIPGTNTLELGIAGVPAVVMLPLNKPEVIPLEGAGHWLSLVPLVGTALKRHAVKLAAPRLPVALPNTLTGQALMTEIKGEVTPERIVSAVTALLDSPGELARRRECLLAAMPRPGAAKRLVQSILADAG